MWDSLTTAWAWLLIGGDQSFASFYADALRSNLFAGFLTLCAFLYSVKTFLLVTLHKDVYSTVEYGNRVKKLSTTKKPIARYGQLRRLNRSIFWAVWLTFIAAILQLTIGMIDANWAAVLCVAISVIAAIDVAYNLFVQRGVIDDWLEFLEEQSNAGNTPP